MLKQAAANHSAHGHSRSSSGTDAGPAARSAQAQPVFFFLLRLAAQGLSFGLAHFALEWARPARPLPGPAARIRPSAETRLGSI